MAVHTWCGKGSWTNTPSTSGSLSSADTAATIYKEGRRSRTKGSVRQPKKTGKVNFYFKNWR